MIKKTLQSITLVLPFIIGNSFAITQIDRSEIYEFADGEKYFPYIMKQYKSPIFIWEDFIKYNKSIWGDNAGGNVTLSKSINIRTHHISGADLNNKSLSLKQGQMVWLLDRLSYGSLEFRTIYTDPLKAKEDKYFGFGDPGEGFAAGYRLQKENGTTLIKLTVINYGKSNEIQLPWKESWNNARFFVDWRSNSVVFRVIDKQESKIVGTIFNKIDDQTVVPDIRMEISVNNYYGGLLNVDLVKYDAH